jgi:hypothetical protein
MKPKQQQPGESTKDTLSQADLKKNVRTYAETKKPHAPLETPEGKNNGAEPAVYRDQQKSRT